MCRRYCLSDTILERIRFVAGLIEAFRFERVAVDDQDAARAQVGNVRGERGGVHRHEGVDLIAGREDIGAGKMDLKTADAGQRALRRANFGREVGERRDVVAHQGRRVGELRAGQLHAVARVATETNCRLVECVNFLLQNCGGRHRWKRILALSCRTEDVGLWTSAKPNLRS